MKFKVTIDDGANEMDPVPIGLSSPHWLKLSVIKFSVMIRLSFGHMISLSRNIMFNPPTQAMFGKMNHVMAALLG